MYPVEPILPGTENVQVTWAKDQPEYLPLPTIRTDKCVVSRWRFTDEERQFIAEGGDLFVFQMTFGEPLQPVMPAACSDDAALQLFMEQS